MDLYLVVGHYTPTDADPVDEIQGKLEGSQVVFFPNREAAEDSLMWYQDGIIFPVELVAYGNS